MDHRRRWDMRIHKHATPWILVPCFWRRYAWISTLQDTYNELVFAQKYVNAEAQNTIAHSKMMINRLAASELTYFCAETSALYVSWSVDIQAYLLQKQRTSIRKVPLFQKLHHFLIVLRPHYQRDQKPNRTTIQAVESLTFCLTL